MFNSITLNTIKKSFPAAKQAASLKCKKSKKQNKLILMSFTDNGNF